MALTVGSRLGHYDVTALIGEGGMGRVYRATDTQLGRDVALKILPDAFASDPDRLARFQREAQVLASLNHPNIAAIYGIEKSEDTQALVLELVEGPTLADRISKGPIPLDEALPIAKQIAEALEAAHEAGVIHRDLKPANVKVREDGTVKVLDFGLAKALDTTPEGDPSQSPTLTAAATQMGVIMGTAAYMSPEQAKGRTVDKRSDVWAFGAVLYEMLAGRRAFDAEDVSETLAAVLRAEVNWTLLPKELSPALRTFLVRCLQKDPKQRVPDIAAMRLALEGAFETTVGASSEQVPPPLAVWQRPALAAIAALALLAIGGAAVWTLTRPAPPRVVRFPIPLAAGETFLGVVRSRVAISPDGSHVVYAASNGLRLRAVDQLRALPVPGTGEGTRAPFFSADGQSIGFWADGRLQRIAVSGGAPVTLADMSSAPFGTSWGADDMILYSQNERIMQVSGASTPVLLIPAKGGELLQSPQMLPGGEWVLLTVRAVGASWDEAQIVAQSVTTGERTVLIDGGRDGQYLPTGHLVYGLNNVLFAVPFDVGSHEVTARPVPVVEGVSVGTGNQSGAQFAVSASGSLVYVPDSAEADGVVAMTWVDRNGGEEMLSAPRRAYGRPRMSPDGTRVAVDITDWDNRDIWIWNVVEERLMQLTFDEADDNYALWTPDSARVVFASRREGGGVFWKAADGTGPVERLKDGLARPYAWTADGRLIFEEGQDIGVLTMDGDRAVEILLDAEHAEGEPALSPDGRWLAYYTAEISEGEALVYVQPFPSLDGLWNVSLGWGVQPLWSPNGRELFFRSRTGLMMAQIDTEPTFSSGTPQRLFSMGVDQTPEDARMWDIAPEGDRFIFTRREAARTSGDDALIGLIFVENWFQELTERVPVP